MANSNDIDVDERFIVDEALVGKRMDGLLVNRYSIYSRSHLQRMLKCGLISLNGVVCKASARAKIGDEIHAVIETVLGYDARPEDIALDIVFEDEHFICVNKPAPMVVYPSPGHKGGVLVNAVLAHCPDLPMDEDEPERPGIVHRLDKDTSGVILLAKSAEASVRLKAMFKSRKMQKHYVAIVKGQPADGEGVIEDRLMRSLSDRKKMVVNKKGKHSNSRYCVRSESQGFSLVDIYPKTGRMHQIRVHMATSLGCPVLADKFYGRHATFYASSLSHQKDKDEEPLLTRHALHAASISFVHPFSDEEMTFCADLPEDMRETIRVLKL